MHVSTALYIERIEAHPLSLPLLLPFSISTGAQAQADNVLVRVFLSGGIVGLGEAAPFPAVNGETQAQALEALEALDRALRGRDAGRLAALPTGSECKSAQCAVEVALLDAFCRAHGLSMWRYFGGQARVLLTDFTVTTGTAEAAQKAAARIVERGFTTLKLKVGGVPLDVDEARIEAVVRAAPGAELILDGNCAFSGAGEVLRLCRTAERVGGRVVLIEQPFSREDEASQAELAAKSAVPVAADESVASVGDVVRIAERKLAQIVNLKPMKSGFFAARDMAIIARALGLGTMIGAMVETELALSASACLAAGLGGVQFCDLDTHMFLAESPMRGGFRQEGPRLDLSSIHLGHGVTL